MFLKTLDTVLSTIVDLLGAIIELAVIILLIPFFIVAYFIYAVCLFIDYLRERRSLKRRNK